jgi:hypothetical protein
MHSYVVNTLNSLGLPTHQYFQEHKDTYATANRLCNTPVIVRGLNIEPQEIMNVVLKATNVF